MAKGLDIVDSSNLNQVHTLRKRCLEYISDSWMNGTEICGEHLSYIVEIGGNILTYNANIFDYEWAAIEDPVNSFLANCSRKEDLYKAIHIENSTKVPVYEPSSGRVAKAYEYEEMLDWSKYYDEVM